MIHVNFSPFVTVLVALDVLLRNDVRIAWFQGLPFCKKNKLIIFIDKDCASWKVKIGSTSASPIYRGT
jgi:hypothetical protein